MRFGLPVSFLAHGALLAYALLSYGAPEPFKPTEPEPVEVAIITEDGLTRLRQGDRASKLLEAKEAPPAPKSNETKEIKRAKPPEPAAPPPEPPPEPAKAEPTKAEPAKAEPAKAEPPPEQKPDPIAEKLAMLPPEPAPVQPKGPTPEELARQEAQKKAAEEKARAEAAEQARQDAARKAAEAKKKADEKKRKELADKKRRDLEKKKREQKRLAELKRKKEAENKKRQKKDDDFFDTMQKALKDNDPTKRAAPTGGATTASNATRRGPTAGAPEGTDTRLTASQNAMLGLLIKDAVKRCWSILSGAEGVQSIVVRVDVRLNPDGTFAREPRVVNSMPGPLFASTADSAIRAVKQCAPYDFPKDLYKGGWEALTWTFDPRKMF